jgi:hypothetical protein
MLLNLVNALLETSRTGAKLSTVLSTFALNGTQIDKSLTDLAGDVALTSTALTNVGDFFHAEPGPSKASQSAFKDTLSILQRCQDSFSEIEGLAKEKHRKSRLRIWSTPSQELKMDLLRKRLESLKCSLVLLLSVLNFSNDCCTQYV